MAIIEKPLNVFEIADLLGYYEYAPHPVTGQTVRKVDAGRLCTHANINKWSKYKPVIQPSNNPYASPTWWKAQNGNCGLVIPQYNSLQALSSGVTDWEYQKPTGGVLSPFRVGDFYGYEQEAQPTFAINPPAPEYYKDVSFAPMSMNIYPPAEYELALSDIGNSVNLGSMYFGVGIKIGASFYNITNEDNVITDSGGGVQIPLALLPSGTYTVYMFLSSVKKTAFNQTESGIYIPLPGGSFVITVLNVAKTRAFIIADINEITRRLTWSVTLENNDTVPKTITDFKFGVRYGDLQLTAPFEPSEREENIGSMTAAAGSSVTVNGTWNSVLTNFATRGGYVFLTSASNSTLNIYRQDIGSQD